MNNKRKYKEYQITRFPCPTCGSFISGSPTKDGEYKCISCGTTIRIDHKPVSKEILDKLAKATQ